jgi:hypothetical protein
VKVGDLVRYRSYVRGMEGLRGIIVDWNGEAAVVYWPTRSEGKYTDEISMFIEVINEREEVVSEGR